MTYWHHYQTLEHPLADILGGTRYSEQQATEVVIDGKEELWCFFEGEHNIALGLSADGMRPSKCCKQTCWPLLLINYSLDPEICTQTNHLICVGVVTCLT
jgi:hypothetical protein